MSKRFFITATETGAGKTHVTACLLRAMLAAGTSACAFKPVSTGDRSDAEVFSQILGGDSPSLEEINPFHLKAPMAPYAASILEDRMVNFFAIDNAFDALASRFSVVLVEGAGGAMTPLTATETMRDLGARWGGAFILVVPNRLGALSQAFCAAECLEGFGAGLAAVVLNEPDSTAKSCLGDDVNSVQTVLLQSNRALLDERFLGRFFSTADEGWELALLGLIGRYSNELST